MQAFDSPVIKDFLVYISIYSDFGFAHLPCRVALAVTMNDKFKSKDVAKTAVHKLAHLLGKLCYDPKSHPCGIKCSVNY